MKSAMSGPLVVYGDRPPPGTGAAGSNNPDKAPSIFWGGAGLIDPRVGYNNTVAGAVGFPGAGEGMLVIDAQPAAPTSGAIAAAQVPVAATPLTLTASGAATLLGTALYVYGSGNTIPVNAIVIDGSPGLVSFGRAGSGNSGHSVISYYDPTKQLSRTLSFLSVGNDTTATATVKGFDVYGAAMTETVTLANATTAVGKKAWKFVTSVTPAGTLSGSNLSVGVFGTTSGTLTNFGFPIRVDSMGFVSITYNNATITANTGMVFADTTNPATATTGDVRGTYQVQSVPDATKRLTVFITSSVANIGSNTGLFGMTQFS